MSLSKPELERLAVLNEECAEVQQIISKIIRFGYESTHPDLNIDNRQMLKNEIGDVLVTLKLMEVNQDFDMDDSMYKHMRGKVLKLTRYLKYNICRGLKVMEIRL